MFTRMPSSASVRVAARPSTIVGIFTTTLGAMAASSRPSRTISSRVMATLSADTGHSGPTMSQMRLMWLWKSSSLPPMRAYSEGLVVTPASAPQLAASLISSRSAVSKKNFTLASFKMCGWLSGHAHARTDSQRKITRGRSYSRLSSVTPLAIRFNGNELRK